MVGAAFSDQLLSSAPLGVAAALVGLGALAETLPYHGEGRGLAGSVSFVPYSAALLALPDQRVLLLVAGAQTVVQVLHRRSLQKSLFNIAQFSLSLAVGLVVLRGLGGTDTPISQLSFLGAVTDVMPRALPAFLAVIVVNKIAVSTVVGAATGQSVWRLLTTALRSALLLLLMQMVFGVYLCWLAVNLGVVGSLGMAIPMLAVRQLSRTTLQLTKVTEELLDLMVAAIEARDPYTSGHSKRVAHASVLIAKAIGLRPAEVERVQVAALLHDVGKIHEEFARVLAKEGRLTPEEWEIMKRHPVRSAELVALVTTLRDVVPAVRHHHENWDGTGYPDGKVGGDIPLASRIIMFADTLDAITTDRPYRKALDPDEARKEFIKFRAKQFDPSICDVVVGPEVWAILFEATRRPKAPVPSDPGVDSKAVA